MTGINPLHGFLRGEFDVEAKSGFARLKRVPQTNARHFLDYYLSLGPNAQNDLADAATTWAAAWLAGINRNIFNCDLVAKDLQTIPAWNQWGQEMTMGKAKSRRYWASVPMIRTALAQIKIDRARGKPSHHEAGFEEFAASIKSVKAPELRKHVQSALMALFDAKPCNIGGAWEYSGTLNGSQVSVNVDYGGRHAQLRYEVTVSSSEPDLTMKQVGFETTLGVVTGGDWNFIIEDNVADSMNLLCECIDYVSRLPKRFPSVCLITS